MEHDEVVVARSGDDGKGLVKVYLRHGELVQPLPSLAAIRALCESEIAQVPEHLTKLAKKEYAVIVQEKHG